MAKNVSFSFDILQNKQIRYTNFKMECKRHITIPTCQLRFIYFPLRFSLAIVLPLHFSILCNIAKRNGQPWPTSISIDQPQCYAFLHYSFFAYTYIILQ